MVRLFSVLEALHPTDSSSGVAQIEDYDGLARPSFQSSVAIDEQEGVLNCRYRSVTIFWGVTHQ
jgi:hypothetical protein